MFTVCLCLYKSFCPHSPSPGFIYFINLFSNMSSCVKESLSLTFFRMPRCVLRKCCRPDCRELLYRGSIFFLLCSQGCFSFMKGRFRKAMALVWTICVIRASRMNKPVSAHTHTQEECSLPEGGWHSVNTVGYMCVRQTVLHAWWGHSFAVQQASVRASAACLWSC